jgi:hypothetical protein
MRIEHIKPAHDGRRTARKAAAAIGILFASIFALHWASGL